MKKNNVKIALLLLVCIILCVSVAAAEKEKNGTLILKSQDEVIENIHLLFSEDEFGGVFLEGDTLVINIVGNEGTVNVIETTDRISANVAIEYRIVEHPLRDLENIKDYLTQYMTRYNISALDANEVTNQVDVYLINYSDSIIDKIKSLVKDQYSEDIIVNFIDKSGTEIRYTVADVASNDNPDNLEQNGSVRVVTYSGAKITINGGGYTLGPALSSLRAITAGHGYTGTYSFYSYGTSWPSLGNVTSHYGGSTGDWGNAVPIGGTVGPVVGRATPISGATVYMWGGYSGITSGTITSTNVTISALPPYAALTGMCAGNYFCAHGDSGAGLFTTSLSNYSSSTSTYGVQSSATFNSSTGAWVGPSYFTPITKVP